MPKLIRKINQNRWTLVGEGKSQLSSDSLSDMITRSRTISFWRSHDDESKEKIFIALCVSCNSIDKLDYAEIDEDLVTKLGITINSSIGRTPYEDANSLHVDLENLTVDDIANLSKEIKFSGNMGRKQRREMIEKVRAVRSDLNSELLSEGIKKDIVI